MKIALCLSGLIRNSLFCFPYIYNNFLNTKHHVDVFIHTWNDSPIIPLYNPTKIEIEDNGEAIRKVRETIQFLPNLKTEGRIDHNISMYYSIHKSFNLVPPDYDVVIRCRFDLLLQNRIDLDSILQDLQTHDLYIPGRIFNVGGYNDQIGFGTYEGMKIYSDTVNHLDRIQRELGRWHPESFLGWWLDHNNLKIKQDDYDFRIVRDVQPKLSWPENPFQYHNH